MAGQGGDVPSDGSTGAAPAQGLVSQIWQHKCTKRLITGTALGTCFCAVDGRNTYGSHVACFVHASYAGSVLGGGYHVIAAPAAITIGGQRNVRFGYVGTHCAA